MFRVSWKQKEHLIQTGEMRKAECERLASKGVRGKRMLLSVCVHRGGGKMFFFSKIGGELGVHCIYIICMADDFTKFFNH